MGPPPVMITESPTLTLAISTDGRQWITVPGKRPHRAAYLPAICRQAFFEAAVLRHDSDERSNALAEMLHFILAVVAAAAGLAKIHSTLSGRFLKSPFIRLTDLGNGARGFMSQDFDTRPHGRDCKRAADCSCGKSRADRAI